MAKAKISTSNQAGVIQALDAWRTARSESKDFGYAVAQLKKKDAARREFRNLLNKKADEVFGKLVDALANTFSSQTWLNEVLPNELMAFWRSNLSHSLHDELRDWFEEKLGSYFRIEGSTVTEVFIVSWGETREPFAQLIEMPEDRQVEGTMG
jgi:hypothetical protein